MIDDENVVKNIRGVVRKNNNKFYLFIPKMRMTIPLPCSNKRNLTKYPDIASNRQNKYIEWLKGLSCSDKVKISIIAEKAPRGRKKVDL